MEIKNVYTKIQQQLDLQLPFVAYQKANTHSLQVFLQEDSLLYEVKGGTDSGFVFAPFDSIHKKVLIPSQKSTSYTVNTTDQTHNDHVGKSHFLPEHDIVLVSIKENHKQLVAQGKEAIKAGVFEKVVLSRREEIDTSITENPLQLFKKLLFTYPKAFVYIWYHPQIGLWLGATPETLIKVKDHNFSTMALAGTQPFIDTINVDWGAKELVEQEMVTTYVIKELSTVVKDIEYSETYTDKAGTLLHLRTDINGILSDTDTTIENIINVLHPTPAVCGLPKNEAKSFILKKEGYDRKYYTGFLGELNIKKEGKVMSEIFVNLRCMEIEKNKAILYVGGGITKDSDPEKEWEETVRKTETMKKVLF
ncbi:chorismate-binding protein [Aquimarina sp. I32.4]|uniref:chorismate-binding protein n=1 Tax=Aquimarina sp. I32.4 TaxID=2053903 RepID=UPI000CDED808|nr:chorismate-binding protein [Aquimarina sp. I32.4]